MRRLDAIRAIKTCDRYHACYAGTAGVIKKPAIVTSITLDDRKGATGRLLNKVSDVEEIPGEPLPSIVLLERINDDASRMVHNLSMKHSDFLLGGTFWCGGRVWRCTDIGTRTIAAICIDRTEIQLSSDDPSEAPTLRMLTASEAEAEGLFNGPPYAVEESIFDEYDVQGCLLHPEDEDASALKPGHFSDVSDATERTDEQWEQGPVNGVTEDPPRPPRGQACSQGSRGREGRGMR